jgi:hypothetical protein
MTRHICAAEKQVAVRCIKGCWGALGWSPSLSLSLSLSLSVCVWGGVHCKCDSLCMNTNVEAREQPHCHSSDNVQFVLLRQCLSFDLELAKSGRLAGQQPLGSVCHLLEATHPPPTLRTGFSRPHCVSSRVCLLVFNMGSEDQIQVLMLASELAWALWL